MAAKPMIEINDLKFTYPGIDGHPPPGSTPLIENFSLSLFPGERCLLVGSNGAGKTTILKILGGKHMVEPHMVRVLGRSAFHDTALTSSGDLCYLGGERESTSCFDTVKKSWEQIEVMGIKADGLQHLSRKFNLCQNLNSSEDLSDWLDSAYSYLAMVDYPYSANFMMPLPANPIKEVCRKIDSHPEGTSILDRIFSGISIYYNYTGTVECFDLGDDPHGMSGWDWQACTEMVMPMSSSRKDSMFPAYEFDYASYKKECLEDFGVKPRPRWITTEFGGHDLRTSLKTFGSNIIFSNGLLDPWSGGGVLQNVSESIVALVTNEVEQRKTKIKLIHSWITSCYAEKIAHFNM